MRSRWMQYSAVLAFVASTALAADSAMTNFSVSKNEFNFRSRQRTNLLKQKRSGKN